MLSFMQYILLIEGKADDFRAANPHLKFLSDAHAIRYGRALSRMKDLPSDPEKVKQTLKAFDTHGSKLEGRLKDFNQHPSFEHVESQLRPHIEKTEKEKEKKSKALSGEEVLHDDEKGTVVKEIHTHEAASRSLYCDKTQWCVSRKGETGKQHFDSYASRKGTGKGGMARLFVIHTPDGNMYAHHEGEGGIVRDKDDKAIPVSDFVKKYPSVGNATRLHATTYGINFNLHATSDDISKELNNDDPNRRIAAIQHPNATTEHTDKALEDDHPDVRKAAIKHPNVKHEHLNKALDSEDSSFSEAALQNPNLSPEHISKALENDNPFTRKQAIRHPKANETHLLKAINDVSFDVKRAALEHPNLPSYVVNKALTHSNKYIRQMIVKNPNLTSDHLTKALNDSDHYVRGLASKHPNIEAKHITQQLNHPETTDDHVNDISEHPLFNENHITQVLNDPKFGPRAHASAILHPKRQPEHIEHVLGNKNYDSDVRQTALAFADSKSPQVQKVANDETEDKILRYLANQKIKKES